MRAYSSDAILRYAVNVGTEEILGHDELRALFDTDSNDSLRSDIVESISSAVKMALPQLLQDVNIRRKRVVPSVDVTVNSDELSRMPEESIHTLHFKVSPSSIKFYTDEQ